MSQLRPERQVTQAACGHILTNVNVWSPDSRWIVYDVRSDPAGSVFDGSRIERVCVATGEVQVLYQADHDACCGVVTCSPTDDRVVFIHGPEWPDASWSYCAEHRRGVLVRASQPGNCVNLDARQLVPPFAAGALRGGTHVHVFSPDGLWVSHTYEDHVLAQLGSGNDHDWNQRNIGVSVPVRPVATRRDHPRNHDGTFFTVLVSRTLNVPHPGSDEISRAFSDAWVGTGGYRRADHTRQPRAIAFFGQVMSSENQPLTELFVVDLPKNLTIAGPQPLEGTETTRPAPPRGTRQRRLTHTEQRRFPGIQGPRHWPRSAPDGAQIAFLMKDDLGIVQLWTVSPCGGEPRQLTRNAHHIDSAFTWSPNGHWIAHTMDRSVCVTDARTGRTTRLTAPAELACAPRPEACVFSPDGQQIAYVRSVPQPAGRFNQIFVVAASGTE